MVATLIPLALAGIMLATTELTILSVAAAVLMIAAGRWTLMGVELIRHPSAGSTVKMARVFGTAAVHRLTRDKTPLELIRRAVVTAATVGPLVLGTVWLIVVGAVPLLACAAVLNIVKAGIQMGRPTPPADNRITRIITRHVQSMVLDLISPDAADNMPDVPDSSGDFKGESAPPAASPAAPACAAAGGGSGPTGRQMRLPDDD
jgi:hypothetical protein